MKNKVLIGVITILVGVIVVLFFCEIFDKKESVTTNDFNLVFISEKTDNDAYVKVSEDGKTLTFATEKFKNIGDTTTLEFKIENVGSKEALIKGVICSAKGSYKDFENPTEEEKNNADKNAIDFSNYLSAGLSNKLANTKLKAKEKSKKETLAVNVTRELKDKAGLSMMYECKIDAEEIK